MEYRTEQYLLIAATVSAAVLLVAAASVAGLSPLQSTTGSESPETVNATVGAESNDSNLSDSVVRHRNPESIETSTVGLDRTGLELAQSLGIRLEVSARDLREEDFSAAEQELGSEYQNDVIKLTEIAEATENASDDEIAEAYRQAGAEQRGAIRNGEQFQELYTEYQQARASQNETRAREVAQQLSAEYEEIDANASNLREVYRDLEQVNESQAKLAQQRINQTLDRAASITQNTREATYTETVLTVTTIQPHSSPTHPFTISGQLRTIDGEPLANRDIVIGSAAYNTTVQTNRNGRFTLRHRPTILEEGLQSVEVRYVPNATAGYLGDTATTEVSVVQRDSTVNIRTIPGTVTNGTEDQVTGHVQIDTEGVEGVPVALYIGDTQIATDRTNASGGFNFTASPLLSMPAGETTATVVVMTTDQAVASSQQTTDITVDEVPTTLSLSVDRAQSRTIYLAGTLRRQSGQPIASKTVTISAGDRTLGWFQTNENGQFSGNLTLVADHPGIDSSDVSVTATFSDSSTHLGPTQTAKTVTLPSFAPPGVFGYGIPARAWGLFASGIVLVSGALFFTRRRLGTDASTDTQSPEPAPAESDRSTSTQSTLLNPLTLLNSAQTTVTDAPRDATRLGYTAVRNEIARELDLDHHASMTYWEFNEICQNQPSELPSEWLENFQQLTELYEQAAYTDRPVSAGQVDELLQYFRTEFVT